MASWKSSLPLILAAAAALLGGCGNDTTAPGDSQIVTAVFRDGADPTPDYYGTRDAVIRNGPTWDVRAGNAGRAAVDTLGSVEAGRELYGHRMLIRFNLTSITSCETVTGAFLTLHVEPRESRDPIRLEAWEATVPPLYPGSWVEGYFDEGVSWLYVDEQVTEWANEGGDHLAKMDTVEVYGDETVTFELDPAVVEKWIKSPAENDGVLIIPETGTRDSFLLVHMRESEPSSRPELLVRYIKGG